MKTFTVTCVSFYDFCNEYNISYELASDIVSNSDYSYGTNDDTLVKLSNLCSLLEIEVKKNHDPNLMVSLGS